MNIRNFIPTLYGDFLTRFGESWSAQSVFLKDRLGEGVEEVLMPPIYPTDMPIIYIKKDFIVTALGLLKTEPGCEYDFLADLTATDEQSKTPRFEVVYHLYSLSRHWRMRVKVRLQEGEDIPTVTSLWKGADWAEREVWDMFGIRFRGHPDLRRILMDQRWVGHPLRKDYPLRGYQIFPTPEPIDPSLLEKK